jgi:hypothetical protein
METDISKLLVQIIIYFCIFVCGFAISTPVGIASLKQFIKLSVIETMAQNLLC